VQKNEYKAWSARLRVPDVRARVAKEMVTPTNE